MATVGTLAVKIVADAHGFTVGINDATNRTRRFGREAKSIGADLVTVRNVVAAAAYAVGGFVKQQIDSVVEFVKTAREIGSTTSGLMGLADAARRAGQDTSLVADGIRALNERLTEAARGGVAAEETFKLLGVSAKDLQGLPSDAAFLEVAGAFAAIKDPAKQAALAIQLFGQNGQRLLPILAQGKEGLMAAQDWAKKTGAAIGDLDAGAIEAVSAAFSDFRAVLGGIVTKILVELAPWILAVTKQFDGLGQHAWVFANAVVAAFEFAARGVALIIDIVTFFKIGLKLVELGFLGLIETIQTGIIKLFDQLAKLPDRLGGKKFKGIADAVRGEQAGVRGVIEGVGGDLRKLLEEPLAQDKVGGFFEQLKIDAQKAGKELDALRSGRGAERFGAKDKRFFVANKKTRNFGEGSRVLEDTATPFQRFRNDVLKTQDLLGDGAIAFDVYAKAAGKAVAELERAHQLSEIHLPSTAQRGTVEARSAEVRGIAQEDARLRESPQERTLRIIRESLEIEKRQLEQQRTIAKLLESRPKLLEAP